MAQLQRMDACLDTLSTELYQVNIRVDRIARRQATPSPPSPVASDSEDDDDDDDSDDDDAFDDADGDASSSDEMST